MKVAINGFGRIGKLVFRAFLEKKIKNIDIVAINELGNLESSHHLLQYDSIHGKLPIKISKTKNIFRHFFKHFNIKKFFSQAQKHSIKIYAIIKFMYSLFSSVFLLPEIRRLFLYFFKFRSFFLFITLTPFTSTAIHIILSSHFIGFQNTGITLLCFLYLLYKFLRHI